MTILGGRGHLVTKVNIIFFVENEVLNTFHLTVFSKKQKKTNIFQNNRNFFCVWGDDKNEYNLSYGKWGTENGFEDFFSNKAHTG